ncbi:ABC transporter ATP-binding protein [Lewinellaceae bacterium SD302]|nr:ABC transporter ATP-binding protein [Lewinellaceae bacterium SD302]
MSFPYFQQLEALDCGAACLRMVAKSHGRYYSLEYLREQTRISREGVTLAGISDGAEAIGLQTLALPVTLEQLRNEIPLPCVIPWGEDHFVVLYEVKGNKFLIADPEPAVQKARYSEGQMKTYWMDAGLENGRADTGVCLVLETTPEFFAKGKEGVDKSSIGHVWGYIRKYQKLLWQLAGGLIVGMVLQIMFPFLLKNMVDVGIVYDDSDFITLVVIAQGVLFVTLTLISLLRRWILLHIGTRVNVSLISDFISKLTRLPMNFFNSRLGSDLVQRINDHDRVQRFLTGQTLMSIFSLMNFVAFGFVLALWNKQILGVFLVGTVLHLGWLYFFQRQRRELDIRRLDQAADNQAQLQEIVSGMAEIKLYGAERRKRWSWERNQAHIYHTSVKLMQIDQVQRTGAGVLNESKNLIITFLAAIAVLNNTMSIGMLVAIHYILAQLNVVIRDFADLMHNYQESALSLERMDEVHGKQDEDRPEEQLGFVPESDYISVDQVDFHYVGPHSPQILRNVTTRIPRNKITAIVGSSGSGKSTLLQILLGFYAPSEGTVSLGTTNLHAIENQAWRKEIGMVQQDGFIFSETIAKNIALGDEVIDQQRLLEAVRIAQIQSFIEGLPMGYKTPIGEKGMGLSRGQQQRILIARAIYKNPKILFLDEATTGLNAFTEVLIMDELLEHFKGRTVIMVAQRYTTIRQADHIIVLESGEIVEQGSHGELMYERSTYFNLVQQQVELGS